jgi:hypothetical protein
MDYIPLCCAHHRTPTIGSYLLSCCPPDCALTASYVPSAQSPLPSSPLLSPNRQLSSCRSSYSTPVPSHPDPYPPTPHTGGVSSAAYRPPSPAACEGRRGEGYSSEGRDHHRCGANNHAEAVLQVCAALCSAVLCCVCCAVLCLLCVLREILQLHSP